MSQNSEFSGWKSLLWPVHRGELRKLIPMLAMFFLISMNYNILRAIKDSLIITAKDSGAEVIPFIKVWMMLPAAFIMTYLFTRLANYFSCEKVFYIMMSIFLLYFALFIGWIYPHRHILHLDVFANYLQETLPVGCKGMIAAVRYWTFTSFYVMSELWGAILLFTLFWGFANETTQVGQAKRFYGLYGIGINMASIAAGQASIVLTNKAYSSLLPFGEDCWHRSLFLMIALVLIAGMMTMVLFRWTHVNVLTDQKQRLPSKKKISLRESFAFIAKSRYLLNIAIVVVAYNVVINFVEVIWKHELSLLYPHPTDYNNYMNKVTTVTGLSATAVAFFISGNSIRRMGWTFTALIAPVILFVTSVFFLGCFFLEGFLAGSLLVMLLGTTPLAMTTFFGALQNCLSRTVKYTLFDATKELAYVPLDSRYKFKSKAAIDGICSRLGKSGGAIIYQLLLLLFSTVGSSAPYVAILLFVALSIWIKATLSLGKGFSEPQQVFDRQKLEPLKT